MSVKTIVVLFSGRGSNFAAMAEALHGRTFGATHIRIAAAITNKSDAGGIGVARRYAIPCHTIDHREYPDRESFDAALVAVIAPYRPDLVVLAGFMRILTPVFTQRVRAVNLHPSLLPLFKGAHAIRESFESDRPEGGVSIHWVSDELDGGAVIAQEPLPKIPGEDLAGFRERIHALEHRLYPETVKKILQGEIHE